MLSRNVFSSATKRNTALMVASGLFLTSCVSAPLSRDDRIGADDGSDVCRANVVALDSTGNFFAEDMLQAAVAGAAAGALAGGLAAAMSGRSIAQGALIGGAVGVVAGAVGGYFKNRMEQGRDQAILSINSDLDKEVGELDKADKAIKELMACRIRQRDSIRRDYAAKRISKPEAERKWAQLRQQVSKDNELMRMVSENIGKRQEEYKYANDQMITEFDASKLTPEERKQATRRVAANNMRIKNEQEKEVADIRREIKQRKKEKSAAAAELAREEQERIARVKEAAEAKRIANEKTGGNEKVVAVASSFSASQAKKESITSNATNYAAKVQVDSDNGFENTSGLFNVPMPNQIAISGACPLPAEGQGMSLSQIGWNHWLSSSFRQRDTMAAALAG